MHSLVRTGLNALSLAALPLLGQAQTIIVGPGVDLAAEVSGAASGTTIEIQSNETYVGSLSWTGRTLTIRAGAGFQPTIQGSDGSRAITLGSSGSNTVGILEGLRLIGGIPDTTNPELAMSVSGTGSLGASAVVTANGCTFGDRVSFSGTGSADFSFTATGCTFESSLTFGGTGSRTMLATISDSTFRDSLSCSTTGDADSDITLRRCNIQGGLNLSAISTSNIEAFAQSCLITNPNGTGFNGVRTSLGSLASVDARFVGLTIAGFPTGVSCETGTAEFENTLFHNNTVDVSLLFGSPMISNCLIPDGTFAGMNGNFQATAILDAAYAPVATSPGVDAGNSGALGVGFLDLNLALRIQDTDGNGSAIVNVGAVETASCAVDTAATELIRLGVPANPNVLLPGQTNGPVLGKIWDPVVDHTTFQTGAAVDYLAVTIAPVNFVVPAWGTLLIDPSSIIAEQTVLAGTPFSIPMPEDCSLAGFAYFSQAASIGPPGSIALTNSIDGVLGLY